MIFAILLLSNSVLVTSELVNINEVARGEVQSCRGCILQQLPEIKACIIEDIPLYKNVAYRIVPNAPPELVLYTMLYEELARFPLEGLSRTGCNQLLNKYGFEKTNNLNQQ